MSAFVIPPKAMRRSAAAPASIRIPFEKTSRSPRFASWRGREPSLAMIEDRPGEAAAAGGGGGGRAGEAVVCGVGRQHEDHRGRGLEQEEEGAVPEDEQAHLGDD